VRLVVFWLVLAMAAVAATVVIAFGTGVLFVWAFSPPMEDGHATAASLSDAFYFVFGALVGGGIGCLVSVVGVLLFGRWLGRRSERRA
jgi:hypothetical protein